MSNYPWQKKQWQTLVNQHRQHQLPHAILLHGPSGLGKLDFAIALAKYIFCEHHGENACEQCRGCHLFSLGNHPDFFLIAPEEKSKSIKIDQIRALTTVLQQTAQRQGFQVAIITPADAMNTAAANALLKTLEEPSGSVILMLVTNERSELPPTIVSRCQSIPFFATADEETLAWLAKELGIQVPQALQLMKFANDAPLAAKALTKTDYQPLREQFFQHLILSRNKQRNPLLKCEPLLIDLVLTLNIWFTILMDLLRLSANTSTSFLTHNDKVNELQLLVRVVPRSVQLLMVEQVLSALKAMHTGIAVNQTLLLENLLLQWSNAS